VEREIVFVKMSLNNLGPRDKRQRHDIYFRFSTTGL